MGEDCGVCEWLKKPGFRFDPSDEELAGLFLKERIEGRVVSCDHLMTELQIYQDDRMPWEIIKDDNPYWRIDKNETKKIIYVFTGLKKKKSCVVRISGSGSWMGQNKHILKNKAGDDIGYNKFLSFCKDSVGKKVKKNKKMMDDDQEHGHWMMHEYSLFGFDNFVLCKIIKEVEVSAKDSVLVCPTIAAVATQDFCDDQERQSGDGNQTLEESTTDWDKNGWTEELYQELGMDSSDVQEVSMHSHPTSFDAQEDNHMAIAVVNQPSDELVANGLNSQNSERFGTSDDYNMEGYKPIFDDFWNLEYLGADPTVLSTNSTWDGSDEILDFSSSELVDLWPNEFNLGRPRKRMRCGEDCSNTTPLLNMLNFV